MITKFQEFVYTMLKLLLLEQMKLGQKYFYEVKTEHD